MSEVAVPKRDAREGRPLGATLWFLWMVGMWVALFVLLFSDKLEELWSATRDLPFLVEIVLWVAFFPWMLGMAVWASSWADWLRVLLVVCFAVGWTIISIPRPKKRSRKLVHGEGPTVEAER